MRLEPGGRIDTLPGTAPDPLLEYRKVLDRATDAEEVTVDGVEAYRFEMPTPGGLSALRRIGCR